IRDDRKYILITGGLGYIGSHTALELLKAGHNIVVIDNLSNSYLCVLERIKYLVKKHYSRQPEQKSIPALEFHEIDYGNVTALRDILDQYMIQGNHTSNNSGFPNRSKIIAVVHFAGHKAVAESIHIPLS